MITLHDLHQAQTRIKGIAFRTPLILCSGYDDKHKLYFKPENFQPIGAFKIRGAYNAIKSLSAEELKRGVVTHSSGNHAQAVAYAAKIVGARAVIVIPQNAPRMKIEKTKNYGAEMVLVGNASEDRLNKFNELIKEQNLVPVPPFDDEKVIAGQGTIGLEILEDLPDVGMVLVPVSGGGLISGIAAAIKVQKPNVKVIGVEPALAADAQESLRTKQHIAWSSDQTTRTIADGLRVNKIGVSNWEHIKVYVDDIVTVIEDEIKEAVRKLALNAKLIAEPSGAVPFAAWLYRQNELPQVENTVAVISGGNIEKEMLAQILGK
ncbi:MAG: threonine/serine dehydratase [Chloroflexi bacterium]|nr:threonine/serine dehydratase [Chloroflexota bacterium]